MKIMTLLLTLILSVTCYAGIIIEIDDKSDLENQDTLFGWANFKLVSFEFIADSEKGKQEAIKLHTRFLENIQGLPRTAVITYKAPEGKSIRSYRIHAEKMARKQKAQMVLWGSLVVDKKDHTYINARLSLLEPAPGIAIKVASSDNDMKGDLIDKPSIKRIDFRTVTGDAMPIAEFASAMAHYYKGSATKPGTSKARIKRLEKAIAHFNNFLSKTDEKKDISSTAVANLFISRAHYQLAMLQPEKRQKILKIALQHAMASAELNPYDADTFTVQAIINSVLENSHAERNTKEVSDLLKKSTRLSPTSSNVKANLSVYQVSEGKYAEATQQIEQIEFLENLKKFEIIERTRRAELIPAPISVAPRIKKIKEDLLKAERSRSE